jgi:hypothetical protein
VVYLCLYVAHVIITYYHCRYYDYCHMVAKNGKAMEKIASELQVVTAVQSRIKDRENDNSEQKDLTRLIFNNTQYCLLLVHINQRVRNN